MTDIADFFEDYPSQSYENVREVITRKYEFNRYKLTGDARDNEKSADGFLNQQLFFRTFMIAFDKALNISGAGTGKTRSFLAPCEWFRTHQDETHIRRVVILSGKTQIEDFKRQLEDVMMLSLKEDPKFKKMDASEKRTAIRKMFKFYIIKPYTKFTKEISRAYPIVEGRDEENKINQDNLIRDYSGTMFILDEEHFIRVNENVHKPDEAKNPKKRSRKPDDDESATAEKRFDVYAVLWRLFHVLHRTKICIVTATPVVNLGSELNYIINLIQGLDMQCKHTEKRETLMDIVVKRSGIDPSLVQWHEPPSWDLTDENMTVEEQTRQYLPAIEKFLHGMIVYVSEPRGEAEISYVPSITEIDTQGNSSANVEQMPLMRVVRDIHRMTLNELQQTATPREVQLIKVIRETQLKHDPNLPYNIDNRLRFVEMTGIQLKAYIRVVTDKNASFKAKGLRYRERAVQSFTFPDGSYGKTGYERWIEELSSANFKASDRTLKDENGKNMDLKGWISLHLDQLSAKMNYSVQCAYLLRGKRYVPLFDIRGSGAYVYCLCLENATVVNPATGRPYDRFIRYRPTEETIFEDVFIAGRKVNRIKRSFPPKYRYAVLHSSISKGEIADIFALANHPDNWDGKYLKVVVITKIGQTGINLFEFRHADMMDAPWNPTSQYQSERRVLRVGAFELNTLHYRDSLNGELLKVDVNVLVCAFPSPKRLQELFPKVRFGKGGVSLVTIDIATQRHTEDIRKTNSAIMRALKMMAVDAQLNAGRNTLPVKYSGTPEADYGSVEYATYPEDIELDFTTYDLLYVQDTVSYLQSKIVEQFKEQSIVTIDSLKESISDIHSKYYLLSLSSMIDSRVNFRNKYGFKCYVRSHNGYYYITRSAPKSDKLEDITTTYYNSDLIGVKRSDFDRIIERESAKLVKLITQASATYDDQMAFFSDVIDGLDVVDIIAHVENALSSMSREKIFKIKELVYDGKINNIRPKFDNTIEGAILNRYYNYLIFVIVNPYEYITQYTNKLLSSTKRVIETLDNIDSEKTRSMLFPESDDSNDIVIFHYLWSLQSTAQRYGESKRVVSGKSKIRMFNEKTKEWKSLEGNLLKLEGIRTGMSTKDISRSSAGIIAKTNAFQLISKTYIDVRRKEISSRYPYYGLYLKQETDQEDSYSILNTNLASPDSGGDRVDSLSMSALLWYMYDLGITTPNLARTDLPLARGGGYDYEKMRRYMIEQTTREDGRLRAAGGLIFGYYTFLSGRENSLNNDCVMYMYMNMYTNDIYVGITRDICRVLILQNFILTDRIYAHNNDAKRLLRAMSGRVGTRDNTYLDYAKYANVFSS